jgi:hypothetical protein
MLINKFNKNHFLENFFVITNLSDFRLIKLDGNQTINFNAFINILFIKKTNLLIILIYEQVLLKTRFLRDCVKSDQDGLPEIYQ